MDQIIKEFTGIYDVQLMLLVVGIGVFTVLVDSPNLWNTDNKKESILAKMIGWAYVFSGVALFVIAKVLE